MTKYSYSTLDTFKKCPLKFKYAKLDRAEALLEESVEAFLGTRVHQALKKLYEDLWMEVFKLDSYALLRKLKSDEWEEEIKKRLREFVILRKDRQIYPSKLKEEE